MAPALQKGMKQPTCAWDTMLRQAKEWVPRCTRAR